jgi:hypothetical protein
MFGWTSQPSTGFAGRPTGDYFAPVYGYDDQGKAVNNMMQMNQINQQRLNPQPQQPTGPAPTQDFFSALAGLLNSGGPANPAMQKPAGMPLGQQLSQYNQAANRQTPIAGNPAFGGFDVPAGAGAQFLWGAQQNGQLMRNPTGGGYVSGPNPGYGNRSSVPSYGSQAIPTRPNIVGSNSDNGTFQMRLGSSGNRWGNVGNPSGIYGGFR